MLSPVPQSTEHQGPLLGPLLTGAVLIARPLSTYSSPPKTLSRPRPTHKPRPSGLSPTLPLLLPAPPLSQRPPPLPPWLARLPSLLAARWARGGSPRRREDSGQAPGSSEGAEQRRPLRTETTRLFSRRRHKSLCWMTACNVRKDSRLHIPVEKSYLGQACQCPDHAGAVAVHCSSRGLQEIPRDIPADTVLLKLDANRISRVPNGAFQHLPQLRELDLSHNAIEAIGPAAFSGLAGGLRLLDLSHNRIRRIPKDALGKLSAKIRLSHNPLHCECALQEALWELKLDPDSVDEIACHTSAQEQFVGKPLIQVLDSGASFCSTHRKTTDVAMLVTMFGWFTMVIAYVVYYVRHNQEDARRHLEYLKSLPSAPVSKEPLSPVP
uniref:Leucine-rich repeat-containing protein 3 n=1 Tax=Mus spicilegus TaxID=10103 RepID=A0A8C6I2F4_MUSSI